MRSAGSRLAGWDRDNGRRSRSCGPHGRPVSSVRTDSAPELLPTVRAAALARPGAAFEVTAGDLRRALRRGREANLIVLLLDTSGSMAARRRGRAVATTALSLLGDAYRRRDRVALLTFREAATVVVPRPGRPSWPPGGCATFRSAAAPRSRPGWRPSSAWSAAKPGATPPADPCWWSSPTAVPPATGRPRPGQAGRGRAARAGTSSIVVDAEDGRSASGWPATWPGT